MRISVSLTPGTERPVTASEIAAFGDHIEALGFHAIYLSDHYIAPHACFHSIAAATVIAAATTRVKVGFAAYQVPLRHPIAVAKKFAMLDALSEGRLIAGFAIGSTKPEFDALGVPFGERGAIMDDAMDAIQTLWTEDVASHAGPYFNFEDVHLAPKPVQRPHPPIWLGTWTAAPRAAARVARYADGWQASGAHSVIADLPEGRASVERACETIGRDPATIGSAYVNTLIHFAESYEKAWAEFITLAARNKHRDPELGFLGDTNFIIAKLQELAEAGMDEVSFGLGVDEHEKANIIAQELMPRFSDA
jgi:probable F420-dependent oxidoreductase